MSSKKETTKKPETKTYKFNVVHKETKAVVHGGFDSEDAAKKYIGNSDMLTVVKA